MSHAHHDGSGLYVEPTTPRLGDKVMLRLSTAEHHQPDFVALRTVVDGEPLTVEASPGVAVGGEVWWEAELPMENPLMHYRWLLTGGSYDYVWLNAAGAFDFDLPDASDFVITTHGSAPTWALAGSVYQVYPDRFARARDRDQLDPVGAPDGSELPTWAVPRPWTAHPEGRSKDTPFEYFGGDLIGVRERLDYIAELGATIVYLTPIFPAESTHRYDAASFDAVDPLLGGDRALDDLSAACHESGLRIIGDITLNHCGKTHPWFIAAQQQTNPERSFFRFGEEFKHGYASWWNVPSLPKFDHESAELRAALITGAESPIRRWLRPPHNLDGWRVDVANMAGRLGSVDVTHDMARSVRKTMQDVSDDLLLVAEHGHDASADLDGDGWHGTMNYAGFTRQVWCWLRSPEFKEEFLGLPVEIPVIDGHQMVSSMRAFHGRIPWQQLLASWNILSSHDTARIRTVVGTQDRQVAALALAVGMPGVPLVFAGDEIGLTGWWGEDARVPFPWHDESTWDRALRDQYRALLQLRATTPALQHGGLRWVHVEDDAVMFMRQTRTQSVLIAVSRAQTAPMRIPIWQWRETENRFGFPGRIEADHLVIDIPGAGASIWELS